MIEYSRYIGVEDASFSPNAIIEAQKLEGQGKEYPTPDESHHKRAVFVSQMSKKDHVAIFVAPTEPFAKKSIPLGPQLGRINQSIIFDPRDRAGNGSFFHICLNKYEVDTLVKETYLLYQIERLLVDWSAAYTAHWFAGFTWLNDEQLDQLAILSLNKIGNKYKVTLADCAEYAKEFGRRVAVHENLASDLSFLSGITTVNNPTGAPLTKKAQYAAELSSRNEQSGGESAASVDESRFQLNQKGERKHDHNMKEYDHDFDQLEKDFGDEFEVPQVLYIYHRTKIPLHHMKLAFANESGEGFLLHLVRKSITEQKSNPNSNGTVLFCLHAKKLDKAKLGDYKLLTEYHVRASVKVMLNEAKPLWEKFGDYGTVSNNCQTFARDFLATFGIYIWFSPTSNGLKSWKRTLLLGSLTVMLSVFPATGFAYLSLMLGLGSNVAQVAMVGGAMFLPFMYTLYENREFSPSMRQKLFDQAKQRGVEVFDNRSKLKTVFHTAMGW